MANEPRWPALFFAVAACSWVPHLSCHYFRLETASGFTLGEWQFTRTDSIAAMAIYGILIVVNLWSTILPGIRVFVAGLSGLLHLGFAGLHAYRIARPFDFEVFGHPWPSTASMRESAILALFGILSIAVAVTLQRRISKRGIKW